MKFRRFFSVLLCAAVLFGFPYTTVSAEEKEPDYSISNGSHSLDAVAPLLGSGHMIENSRATILYEVSSDTLIQAWNADKKMYPASLVKIMTAYIAVEEGILTDPVKVRAGAFQSLPSDSISVDLQTDEIISLENLLYCMIVASANDAAVAIAEHIGGSQSVFVDMMNQYAQELGCTNTNFTNPHGIHHDDQYTSARDMAKILSAAMKNEDFRRIFGTERYTVPATNKNVERELVTGNFLMSTDEMEYYYDARVTGSRTGVDVQGFRCIASTAVENGMELISVVMGSVSIFKPDGVTVQSYGGFLETSELLDAGFENFRRREIVSANQALRQMTVSNGDCDLVMGTRDSVAAVLPKNVGLKDLSFRYTDTVQSGTAPIEKGDRVSYLQVWHGSTCLVQIDVYAMNDVPVAFQKVQPVTAEDAGMPAWLFVLIAIGVLLAAAAGVLVVIRASNLRKHKKGRIRRRRF